jgi:glycosyltransferase involved in cell wall biosynthesis
MDSCLDIITVTKDDFEGVARTIESTRELRDRGDVKQIIVDSSKDEIKRKVVDLTNREKNIQYTWQESKGITCAFNLGLKLSKAEWVWFLNGNDRVHRNVNTENLLYLLRESKADAIIFNIEYDQSKELTRHPPMWAQWPPLKAWIPHPATLTRNHLYKKYGHFNPSYHIAMDYEFWIRCFSKDVVVDSISFPIAIYDQSGVSQVQTQSLSLEAVSIIKLHLWRLIVIWLKGGLSIWQSWRHFFINQGRYD